MVRRLDAFVQSLFWYFYWVWHGGAISEAAIEHWHKSLGWVCRERFDGRGRGDAGYGNASGLAFHTPLDGRDVGAYLWIGGVGGGEVGVSYTFVKSALDFGGK